MHQGQTANSSLGKASSPRAPTTVPVGPTKHITRRPARVTPRPAVMVHFRPTLSAMSPARAKPATEQAPPRMVRMLVALDTLLR